MDTDDLKSQPIDTLEQVHRILNRTLNLIYDDCGLAVSRLEVEWLDNSTPSCPDYIIKEITLTSKTWHR